ncbi:hypothetical protein Tco_0883178 [Tanacetum coccineum]
MYVKLQSAITTRSGIAYEGPSIPTNPSPKKVVERETEETTDKEQTNFQGSTAQIPPPVIPISIPEPDVPTTLPKTTPIPEPDIPKNLPKPKLLHIRHDGMIISPMISFESNEKIFPNLQICASTVVGGCFPFDAELAPTIKSLLMNNRKVA